MEVQNGVCTTVFINHFPFGPCVLRLKRGSPTTTPSVPKSTSLSQSPTTKPTTEGGYLAFFALGCFTPLYSSRLGKEKASQKVMGPQTTQSWVCPSLLAFTLQRWRHKVLIRYVPSWSPCATNGDIKQ